MSPKSGLIFLVVLISANLFSVTVVAQRSRLSTSVRGEKARWVPRSTPRTEPIENSEEIVVPTKPLQDTLAPTTTTEEANKNDIPATTTPIPPSSTTTVADDSTVDETKALQEVEQFEATKKVVNQVETEPAANDDVGSEKKEVRSANVQEAAKDEKIATKRDLPFLILSRPGIVGISPSHPALSG